MRSSRRAHRAPDAARPQTRRELAGHALVVVHPLGPAGLEQLAGEGVGVDRHARADRERRRAVPDPGAHDRARRVVLVADDVRAVDTEQHGELLADGVEQRPGRGIGRHERGDPAERRLFVKERVEPLDGVLIDRHERH
jgi:hypothetical protein